MEENNKREKKGKERKRGESGKERIKQRKKRVQKGGFPNCCKKNKTERKRKKEIKKEEKNWKKN